MNPIQQALEALKPFKDIPEDCTHADRENRDVLQGWNRHVITVGDVRAARTAYEALSKYQDGWVLVPETGYEKLKNAATTFVLKVESGAARSKQSYGEFKAALHEIHSARQHMEGE